LFENRILRRIFGLKRDEVIGGWRKLHSEELHDLYPSPCIIIINEVGRACGEHGADKERVRLLVGKPKGKRPL
jgi:hypothetical protein